jgi:hypothetical protein
MARKPSVIMTPTERKIAVGNAKQAVKAAGARLNALDRATKSMSKAHQKSAAELAKQAKKGQAALDKALKAQERARAKVQKEQIKAEQALVKLAPPQAADSPQ